MASTSAMVRRQWMPASCAARHLEQPWLAADAQQQVVVDRARRHRRAGARFAAAVDGRHSHAEPGLDAMLLVELRAAQPQPLALELAREVLLRQGRAVVGQVGLVAHQHDRARCGPPRRSVSMACTAAWPAPTMTTACAMLNRRRPRPLHVAARRHPAFIYGCRTARKAPDAIFHGSARVGLRDMVRAGLVVAILARGDPRSGGRDAALGGLTGRGARPAHHGRAGPSPAALHAGAAPGPGAPILAAATRRHGFCI